MGAADIGGIPQGRDSAPARLICVATHHKAGTIWIKRVIKALSAAISVPWIGLWGDRHLGKVPEVGRAFLCNWAGYFPQAIWRRADVAFLHVIRDPRDVLLSGCAYHRHAGVKGERFLHAPRADLGGKTYQQHLNALDSDTDRLLFEMDNKHAETVAEMRAWPWGDPRVVEWRYEDMMRDAECARARAGFEGLGLGGAELDAAVAAFWDNSLFGGLARAEDRQGRLRTHVQSGGQTSRWKKELPRAVAEAYAGKFGDDLIALGYETDKDWVRQLAA